MAYEVPPSSTQRWIASHLVAVRWMVGAFAALILGLVAWEAGTGRATRSTYFILLDLGVCCSWVWCSESVRRFVEKWDANHPEAK